MVRYDSVGREIAQRLDPNKDQIGVASDNAVTTENIIIKLGWLYSAHGTAKVYKYGNAVVRGIK